MYPPPTAVSLFSESLSLCIYMHARTQTQTHTRTVGIASDVLIKLFMHACISADWSARIRCADSTRNSFLHLEPTPHRRNIFLRLRSPWASRRWCRSRALARAGHTHTHTHTHTHVRTRALGAPMAQHAAGVTRFREQDRNASRGSSGGQCDAGSARALCSPLRAELLPLCHPRPAAGALERACSMSAGVSGRGERTEQRRQQGLALKTLHGQHRAEARASRSPCRTWPSH
jgi:hypothetical protein